MESENAFNSNYEMAQKVISQLYSIIENRPHVDLFTIIPSSLDDLNSCPIHHDMDCALGLESWCVDDVFRFAQQQIIKLRTHSAMHEADTLNMYLTVALLIQPEVNTFWNIKRDLYTFLCQNGITKELNFVRLVLTTKPKSLQAYSYRMWLITKLPTVELFINELKIVDRALLNEPNNYHAWNHRIWCMENIKTNPHSIQNMIEIEMKFSENFIWNNVSRHAGFHYRQYVIGLYNCLNNKICDSSQKLPEAIISNCIYLKVLINEINLQINELLKLYTCHEAIWSHRRFVFYEIIQHYYKVYNIPPPYHKTTIFNTTKRDSSCCNVIDDRQLSTLEVYANETGNNDLLVDSLSYKKLVDEEVFFLKSLSTHSSSCFQENMYFLKRYVKWLKYFLKFDVDLNLECT